MKNVKLYQLLCAILGIFLVIGCSLGQTPGTPGDTTPPAVVSTIPSNSAIDVAVNGNILATFSEDMDPATITAANFTVAYGVTNVPGIVTYDGPTRIATFAPTANLIGSATVYTATVTTGVKDIMGNAMAANKVWSFTTITAGLGPAPVLLGTANNYVILAKSAITNIPDSVITGNLGLSPAATAAITGFSLIPVLGAALSTQVTGIIYAADMAPPTPDNLGVAVLAMESAYTDAAGRLLPDFTDEGAAGDIGGLTLTAGLHTWTGAVAISTDLTFSGSANDCWILQIPGALTQAASVNIILTGGAQAKNIFWQVSGAVTIGASAHFEGTILTLTAVTLGTNASLNGMIMAQTAVSLDKNTITKSAL